MPPNVCKICSNKQVLAKPGKIIDVCDDVTRERAQEIDSFLWPGYCCNLVKGLASNPCECLDPSSNEPQQMLTPSTKALHTFL
jgi:hypothetical protein